jgi:hypothetical protein
VGCFTIRTVLYQLPTHPSSLKSDDLLILQEQSYTHYPVGVNIPLVGRPSLTSARGCCRFGYGSKPPRLPLRHAQAQSQQSFLSRTSLRGRCVLQHRCRQRLVWNRFIGTNTNPTDARTSCCGCVPCLEPHPKQIGGAAVLEPHCLQHILSDCHSRSIPRPPLSQSTEDIKCSTIVK